MSSSLWTCKTGYSKILARELAALRFAVPESAQEWVRAESAEPVERILPEVCFGGKALISPREISAGPLNAQAKAVADGFLYSIRERTIHWSWPVSFMSPPGDSGLRDRVRAVEAECRKIWQKKISRVAKLLVSEIPSGSQITDGFFVYFTGFNRAFYSDRLWSAGQQRMMDDPQAPSRSFLKIEEALMLMGREPRPGEFVADLGAAPGGWSYSAAKRGANVQAVDNGPLKKGAKRHGRIEHIGQDAFTFKPESGRRFDWLFCDIVEDPYRVLDILQRWFANHWCEHFVVNLKIGRCDPLVLLSKIRAQDGLSRFCVRLTARQLYHNRDEITLFGQLRPEIFRKTV